MDLPKSRVYRESGSSNGPSVDAVGTPVVDPTKNVGDLVKSLGEYFEKHLEWLDKYHAALREASDKRANDLAAAEAKRVDEQFHLRGLYDERLAAAESHRIDAIRAVDVSAVATAAQRASDQATVLATQVQVSADTLRQLVATTATQFAANQQQVITPLLERIASLERAQYQNLGRATIADPQITDLLIEVKSLRDSRSGLDGTVRGGDRIWQAITAVVVLVFGGIAAFSALNSHGSPVVPPGYMQAPVGK